MLLLFLLLFLLILFSIYTFFDSLKLLVVVIVILFFLHVRFAWMLNKQVNEERSGRKIKKDEIRNRYIGETKLNTKTKTEIAISKRDPVNERESESKQTIFWGWKGHKKGRGEWERERPKEIEEEGKNTDTFCSTVRSVATIRFIRACITHWHMDKRLQFNKSHLSINPIQRDTPDSLSLSHCTARPLLAWWMCASSILHLLFICMSVHIFVTRTT